MYAIRWKSPTGCLGGGLYVLSEAQADDWLKYLNSEHRDYTHWKTKNQEGIKCGRESKEAYKNCCSSMPESSSKKEKGLML